MQHAMEAMKSTCGHDVEAPWLLHILRCIRQMYASLIHLDLPSDALDIFGSLILDLRYSSYSYLRAINPIVLYIPFLFSIT